MIYTVATEARRKTGGFRMKRFLWLLLAVVLVVGVMPVSAQEADSRLIAITFDDGPGKYTSQLLDGMDEIGGHVTLFMVGGAVPGNYELVERAYLAGHQIASHSWNHPELPTLDDDGVRRQFASSYNVLNVACGTGTRYMVRFPYGRASSRVYSLVNAPAIFWSVDTLDWRYRDSEKVYYTILREARDGSIVLLHDIHETSVIAALRAMKTLKSWGYELVTVSELYRRRGITLKNGGSYSQCVSNGTDGGAVLPPVITYEQVDGRIQVTITAQPGASVYYNLDNQPIKGDSVPCTQPFFVENNTTIWAVAAFDLNGDRSQVTSTTVAYEECAMPEVTVYRNTVRMTCATPGAYIVYTTDGTAPTVNSTRYTQPVTVPRGTVVYAMACGEGMCNSPVNRLYHVFRGGLFPERTVIPLPW